MKNPVWSLVEKFNPYHDPETGRFASGPGGTGTLAPPKGNQTNFPDDPNALHSPLELDPAADKALTFYLSDGYQFVNNAARTGEPGRLDAGPDTVIPDFAEQAMRQKQTPPRYKDFIAAIDSSLDALPPQQVERQVYRGMNAKWISDVPVGEEFVDHGFVSTTKRAGVAEQFALHRAMKGKMPAVARINTPAGVKMLDVPAQFSGPRARVAVDPGEGEVLLPRGARMKVVHKQEMSYREMQWTLGLPSAPIPGVSEKQVEKWRVLVVTVEYVGTDPNRRKFAKASRMAFPLRSGLFGRWDWDETTVERVPPNEISKFNPHHDEKGRFATAPGGATGTKTKAKTKTVEELAEAAGVDFSVIPRWMLEPGEAMHGILLRDLKTLADPNAENKDPIRSRLLTLMGITTGEQDEALDEEDITAAMAEVFESPEQLGTYTKALFGALPDGDYRTTITRGFKEGDSTSVRVAVERGRGPKVSVEGSRVIDDPGENWLYISRVFTRHPDGSLEVKHESFQVDKAEQGKGVGKRVTESLLNAYREMGVKSVSIEANIDVGGYAWARMGFTPEMPWWKNRLVPEIRKRLTKMQPELPRGAFQTLDALLDGPPSNLKKIAGARHNDWKIGFDLLRDTKWEGYMDL